VLFLLIPLLLIIDKYPKLLKKFSLVAIFFIFHTLVYEILALNLGYWEFPQLQSQYVGWVNLFGVSFPVEELFFYITIGSISLLSYYEFFDDDRK
jgi:hypothetical protein